MQKSKQATLFRSWGGSKRPGTAGRGGNKLGRADTKGSSQSNVKQFPQVASTGKERAVARSASAYVDLTGGPSEQCTRGQSEEYGLSDLKQLQDFFEDDISQEKEGEPARGNSVSTPHNTSILEDVSGFDAETGEQWIYPINYPIRDYQFNIVQKCLFRNTLVCLPTGLGKTFIAAVVMFNFYRWYPAGRVVFLAPTKPLVAQQIEACHNVMGIPQAHLTEMTGNMPPKERATQWVTKRVLFMTPQVMQNDITKGVCPADEIRCVVFDEAHKALGNYSYCQVVKELSNCGTIFRVLALSATPGNDLKAVQQVVTNLHLSHIELRADDSFDIRPYTHQRKVELNVVPLEGEILLVKNAFLKVLSGVVGRLAKYGVVYSANPERLSKFGLLQAREAFRQNPPSTGVHPGTIEGDFATGISLYHAYDLLVLHGLRSFHHYLTQSFSSSSSSYSYSRTRAEIDRHHELGRMLRDLSLKLSHNVRPETGRSGTDSPDSINPFPSGTVNPSPTGTLNPSPSGSSEATGFFYGHPKLKKLEEVVVDHFQRCRDSSDAGGVSMETRVMIFSQYRESVQEIADMLACHAPLVRVMSFVGHGAASKSSSKGLTQKEQTEVVRKFREGGYNTLVATCVGEEGLDIGEVDLIVCFDAHKSPIRLVQRMGRTGRKRRGRIVVIVTQGKEEQTYRKSQSNKSSVHKAIRDSCHSLHFYPHAPRMLPRHVTPQCLKVHMEVSEFKVSEGGRGGGGGRGKGRGRGRQQRLSLGPPPLNKANQRGCLDHEELEEWTRNLSLPDRELRACERAVRECYRPHPLLGLAHLSHGQSRDIPNSNWATQNRNSSISTTTPLNTSVVQKYPLNLSKWVCWQTGQTHSKMVGPSEKTKQFVSLLEFMDLMYSCEGLGESYSTEMNTFLDRNDIHDTGSAAGGSEAGVREEGVREGVREGVKLCKRRKRVLSDSGDDSDFREEGRVREGAGEKAHSEVKTSEEQHEPGIEERDKDHQSSDPMPTNVPPSSSNNPLLPSQCAIPRPPTSDSLDWLDTLEPTQVSTPLPLPPPPPPSSASTHHHHPHSPLDFQFALTKTPPSLRKGKTPFVTPLTTRANSNVIQSDERTGSSTVRRSMIDSVDLFNDISSDVLFEEFSYVSTPHPHIETVEGSSRHPEKPPLEPVAGEKSLREPVAEKGHGGEQEVVEERSRETARGKVDIRDPPAEREMRCHGESLVGKREGHSVHWEPSVTCIPESDDEGGEEEVGEGDGGRTADKSPLSSELGPSGMSDESMIGGRGIRRAKCARPDLLLTQASPSSLPSSPRAHPSPSSHVTSPPLSLPSSDEPLMERIKRRERRKRNREASSEEDAFRRDNQLRFCKDSKIVRPNGNTHRLSEEREFLDEEAELSGEGGGGESGEEGEGEGDGYDMDDSFINDNSVLTQVTPSQLVGRRMARKRDSPVNMAAVYRQSLMSPDPLFRGQVRGHQYRLVLSERHQILRHYMDRASGGRAREKASGKRLFKRKEGERGGEEWEEEEEVSGVTDGGEGVEECGGEVSGESEAEEVMVCYGEEDREEIPDSQSIGEPWDWDEAQETESQEMSQEQEVEEIRTERPDMMDQDEIVSPILLASIEPQDTPTCYTLEVEGWMSDESPSSQ